jgi:uroporphyrin-3 C-methyltransferase
MNPDQDNASNIVNETVASETVESAQEKTVEKSTVRPSEKPTEKTAGAARAAGASAPPKGAPKAKSGGSGAALFLAVIALLGAGGAIGYQYYNNQKLTQALTTRIDNVAQVGAADSRALTDYGSTQTDNANRISQLEKTVQTLNVTLQNVNNQEAQRLVSDTEQTLMIATEALQVTNNVPGALKLMEQMLQKLQAAGQPELANLQGALQKDIQMLQALPQINTALENGKIDTVLLAVNTLPLNLDIQRQAGTIGKPEPVAANLPWWKAIGLEAWNGVKSLVSIRRLDKPQQALLSADQNVVLRENIKLHLISARIALLSRQQASFEQDINAAKSYMNEYLDLNNVDVKKALATLAELSTLQIPSEQPVLSALAVAQNTHIAPKAAPVPVASATASAAEGR